MTSTNDFVSQVSSRARESCPLNNNIQALLHTFVRHCHTCTEIPTPKYRKLRLIFKSVKMVVPRVTLVLACGTQCSTGSRELIFPVEETGVTWSGLTLSLKVPFRILLEISNSWPNLLPHPTVRPEEAGPTARWTPEHPWAVLLGGVAAVVGWAGGSRSQRTVQPLTQCCRGSFRAPRLRDFLFRVLCVFFLFSFALTDVHHHTGGGLGSCVQFVFLPCKHRKEPYSQGRNYLLPNFLFYIM